MKTAYRATIGRITARFNWDRSGVFLAALLFLGECVAVILAVISLAPKGYDPGQLAALLESWPETDRIMARGYTPGNPG